MSKNQHTGDKQQTKPASDAYRNNFDAIFRKKPLTNEQKYDTISLDFVIPSDEECKKQNEKRDAIDKE